MPLYRNLKMPLDTGKEIIDGKGRGVFTHNMMPAKTIETLERLGKIARISTPPLEIFPGWKIRSKKLAREGIVTVEQFYDEPDERLAEILKVKPGTISSYKEELIRLLSIPKPRG